MDKNKWLSRDVLLISFSAFFADLGYQGVTALFPLFLVIELRQPVYLYGLITALSFGAGSLFAYLGGQAGDKYDRKKISILGNIFIPAMAFCGLTHNILLSALLFILGWWARYFRTPARRALLVDVSPHKFRARVFGFLHMLDIAGGMLSAFTALFFVWLGIPIGTIILFSLLPLLFSSLLLFFIKRDKLYTDEDTEDSLREEELRMRTEKMNKAIFTAMLVAATFYGFSFYNLGFPILTAAYSGVHLTAGFELGILTYAIYLGFSAFSGYLLSAVKMKPLRTLWSLGYFPSALASLLIGLTVLFHLQNIAFYLFVAILGAGMGAVETFEPTLTSTLIASPALSSGMGWLSVSRSIGQFLSNLIMGILFSFSQSIAYFYAFLASFIATLILLFTDIISSSNKQESS